MFKLIKTEKFINEYNQWHSRIVKIENNTARESLVTLLQELVNEVKKLDSKHQDLFTTYRIPTNVEENKTKIAEIRKKIEKKLNECEKAGLIK